VSREPDRLTLASRGYSGSDHHLSCGQKITNSLSRQCPEHPRGECPGQSPGVHGKRRHRQKNPRTAWWPGPRV